eukprot:1329618-Amorphochlora_amoeboformis.AAC.1
MYQHTKYRHINTHQIVNHTPLPLTFRLAQTPTPIDFKFANPEPSVLSPPPSFKPGCVPYLHIFNLKGLHRGSTPLPVPGSAMDSVKLGSFTEICELREVKKPREDEDSARNSKAKSNLHKTAQLALQARPPCTPLGPMTITVLPIAIFRNLSSTPLCVALTSGSCEVEGKVAMHSVGGGEERALIWMKKTSRREGGAEAVGVRVRTGANRSVLVSLGCAGRVVPVAVEDEGGGGKRSMRVIRLSLCVVGSHSILTASNAGD